MARQLRILLVEDSEDDALLISRRLKAAGYALATRRVDDRESMTQALKEQEWDLVLCDHSMPQFNTRSAMELIGQCGLDLPLVIVSGAIDEKSAVAAMKAGARDYVMKDNLDRLIPVIERELLSSRVKAEKQEADKALAAQVRFLTDLIATIPAGIFYKNTDGVYLGCNQRFARMLGKDHEDEVKGFTIFELLPPAQAYMHNQMDHELLKRGGNSIYEANMDDSEGIHRNYMIHKAAYSDQQGNPCGIVGVLLDISDQKKAEETRKDLEGQLRQAQKLEAIGTLAGGIAHDFNNILAAIIGYSELAQTQSQLLNHDKITKYLDEVLAASDRAKSLIKQILTFSRRAGQEIKAVNIGLLANEALKLLRASLPPSIDIEISIDPKAGMVLADPTNIHSIVMNLCTNAAHAMRDKGGKLTVQTQSVEMLEADADAENIVRPGPYLELVVADTGHGMSPITLERIFDPYYTTKPVGEGTGLGLSVVHSIIAGMGGSIAVRSKPDQGSVFTLLLPIVNEKETTANSAQAIASRGSERIMLVDDEMAITDIVAKQLGKLGYQTTVFNSGDKAWENFIKAPDQYDAVITDLLMPGMQGDVLAEKIKQAHPQIPVIIHTGFGESLMDEEGKLAFADAVCLKPMHGKDVAAMLRHLLDKHKQP